MFLDDLFEFPGNVLDTGSHVFDRVLDTGDNLVNNVGNTAQSAIHDVGSLGSSLGNNVTDLGGKVVGTVGELGGKGIDELGNLGESFMSTFKIPLIIGAVVIGGVVIYTASNTTRDDVREAAQLAKLAAL